MMGGRISLRGEGMSSFNKVILIGRLTRDPEMRYTQAGKPVATFGLAVDRPSFGGQPGQQKEKEADFFNIVVWDKLAETCSRYLGKGRMVCIEGRLQNRSYTGNDGTEKKSTEIVASDMRMLDSGRNRTESGGDNAPPHPAEAVGVAAAAPPREARPAPAPSSTVMDDVGMDDIPF